VTVEQTHVGKHSLRVFILRVLVVETHPDTQQAETTTTSSSSFQTFSYVVDNGDEGEEQLQIHETEDNAGKGSSSADPSVQQDTSVRNL
jgi:hypothetical protein